ncbi:unnamed protein product [Victoria cruziana]
MADQDARTLSNQPSSSLYPRTSGKAMDPTLKITTSPLNGTNFITWAKSASLYLCRKSKIEYVNGKVLPSNISDPSYEEWEANDKIVTSWLLNSMEPAIAEGFLFLNSAKEVWDALEEMYGEGHNLAKVYLLQQEISKATKGDHPFHLYLSNLKGMWDELAQHRPLMADIEIQKQRVKEDKVFKILAGLGHEFDTLHSQILVLPTTFPEHSVLNNSSGRN